MLDGVGQPGEERLVEQLGQRGEVGGLVGARRWTRGRGRLDGVAPDARLDQRDGELGCHWSCQNSWKVPLPLSLARLRLAPVDAEQAQAVQQVAALAVDVSRRSSSSVLDLGRSSAAGAGGVCLRLQVALQRHGRRLRRDLAQRLADLEALADQRQRRGVAAAEHGQHRLVQLGQAGHRQLAQRRQRLGQPHRLDDAGRRGVQVLARAAGAPRAVDPARSARRSPVRPTGARTSPASRRRRRSRCGRPGASRSRGSRSPAS